MKKIILIKLFFFCILPLSAIENEKVENVAKYFVSHFKEGNKFLLDTNIFTDHCIKKWNLDSIKLNKFTQKFDSLVQAKYTFKYSVSRFLPSFDPSYPLGDYYIVNVSPPIPKKLFYIMIDFIDKKYKINDYYFPDLTPIHPVIDD